MKSWIRVFKILFCTILVSYIALLGLMYYFQRELLFVRINRPVPTPAQMLVPEMQIVTVQTSDGLELRNWFVPPQKQGYPVIIIFFGQADAVFAHARMASLLMNNGFGVLLANYRGYSGDAGSPTEENVYKDARASIAFVQKHNFPIGLMGLSLGSGIAVKMATEYEVQSIVLFSPYSSVVQVAAERFPYIPVRYLMKDRFDSLEKIPHVTAPVMIVMGRKDHMIPFSQGEQLYKAANEPKISLWLDNAGHMNYFSVAAPKVMGFLLSNAEKVPHENSQQ